MAVHKLTSLVRRSIDGMRAEPVQPHPDTALVSKRNVAWARSLSLVEDDIQAARARAIECGACAGHAYPGAPIEVVQLGADLILWLFLFDDRYGEGAGAGSEVELSDCLRAYDSVVRRRELPTAATPFHTALLDLVNRLVAYGAPRAWLGRFADSLRSYFDGCLLEFGHRQNGTAPRLEQYRAIRSLSVGMYPVLDLIELANGRYLNDDEASHPLVARSRRLAALLCSWVNDVYSFPKELRDKDPLNLVSVLAREYALTPRAAVRAAVEVYNLDLAELEQVRAEAVRATGSENVEALGDGLLDWVHGNRAWTELCGRYL